jgi:signal transduction histidine kinase
LLTKILNPNLVDGLNAKGNDESSRVIPYDQGETGNYLKQPLELNLLGNTGLKIASYMNVKELITILYQESSRWVNTANFALVIYDDQTDTLTLPLILYQQRRAKRITVRRSHIRGLVSEVLNKRIPLLISDITQLDRPVQFEPIRPDQVVCSWLGVPLWNPHRPQDPPQGAIMVWSDQVNAFTKGQADRLAALGLPAAIAIRNIQSYQTAQRRALELTVINDIVQTLASTLQLDEVLNRMMEMVEGMLKVEAGALLLTDRASDELVFQVALGGPERTKTVQPFRLSKGQNIASYVALTGQKPVLLTRVDASKRQFVKLASYLQVEPRNCLYVPLILKEQIIGVLAVFNKTEGTFTHHDVDLLNSIATYAAIAIDNARLHESVLAERDRVIEVEEQVRRELAHDLHDGPTQLVSSMLMRLDHCQMALQKEPSRLPVEITEMKKLGREAIHQMRTMLVQLLPLELEQHGQGLAAALRVFLERRQKESPTTKLMSNFISPHPDNQISRQEPQVEKTIFKIVQETVNNALKHAHAGHILVQLEETPDLIHSLIADDGTGFNVTETMENYAQHGSLGMVNIKERAEAVGGELSIVSNPGQGTQITLTVPKSRSERLRKRGTTGILTLPPNIPPTASKGR